MAKKQGNGKSNSGLYIIIAIIVIVLVGIAIWKFDVLGSLFGDDEGDGAGDGGGAGGGDGSGGVINNRLGKFIGADGKIITDKETIRILTEKFQGVRNNVN